MDFALTDEQQQLVAARPGLRAARDRAPGRRLRPGGALPDRARQAGGRARPMGGDRAGGVRRRGPGPQDLRADRRGDLARLPHRRRGHDDALAAWWATRSRSSAPRSRSSATSRPWPAARCSAPPASPRPAREPTSPTWTRPVRKDGSDYVINGAKMWISFLDVAEWLRRTVVLVISSGSQTIFFTIFCTARRLSTRGCVRAIQNRDSNRTTLFLAYP